MARKRTLTDNSFPALSWFTKGCRQRFKNSPQVQSVPRASQDIEAAIEAAIVYEADTEFQTAWPFFDKSTTCSSQRVRSKYESRNQKIFNLRNLSLLRPTRVKLVRWIVVCLTIDLELRIWIKFDLSSWNSHTNRRNTAFYRSRSPKPKGHLALSNSWVVVAGRFLKPSFKLEIPNGRQIARKRN